MQDPNKLLTKIVRRLRTIGTDTQLVEVKEAAWKLPESIGETLSAFMNHTGGILILGLSERRGFTPVEGFNARRLHNALLSACDTITPPCRPDIYILPFEGAEVVAAVIPALEPDLRPAYITDRGPVGGSFIRTGDGDKHLTHYEVDRMCESRMQPVWDTEHVSEASVTDLDAAVLKTMVERSRAMTPSVFGCMAGEEILVKTGLLAEGAGRLVPTLGGLLAAGVYPQQFFPRLNIVLTVRGTGETRSINGPVPCMVETAVNLLAERLRTADGFAYPLRACREAVVNALQHRDYSPEGRGSQVRIDLFDDRLEILNPGGLFRAAVYNRQIHGLAALRNANLTRILECTPCPDADGRPGTVLEPGTQGLLLIDEALEAAGRPRAVVHDWVSAASLVFFREERIVHWTDFEYDLTTALSERDSIAFTEIVRCSGLSRSTVLAKLRRMIDAGLIERTEPLHSPRQRYRLSS